MQTEPPPLEAAPHHEAAASGLGDAAATTAPALDAAGNDADASASAAGDAAAVPEPGTDAAAGASFVAAPDAAAAATATSTGRGRPAGPLHARGKDDDDDALDAWGEEQIDRELALLHRELGIEVRLITRGV